MTRVSRWLKIASITALAVIAGLIALFWFGHVQERTYYGPHSDILHVGERVATAQSKRAVVQSDPAWDEDSCDPDRPISLRLDSGEVVSLPRHTLHR
jgi:hypothetical protein